MKKRRVIRIKRESRKERWLCKTGQEKGKEKGGAWARRAGFDLPTQPPVCCGFFVSLLRVGCLLQKVKWLKREAMQTSLKPVTSPAFPEPLSRGGW